MFIPSHPAAINARLAVALYLKNRGENAPRQTSGHKKTMFWKYIEKINWEKKIQHIPFLKNKHIDINILYKGYVWELGIELCKQDDYFDKYGWRLRFTIIGILFVFYLYDEQWYNKRQDRCFLEDPANWAFLRTGDLELLGNLMQKKEMRRKEKRLKRKIKMLRNFKAKLPQSFALEDVYKVVWGTHDRCSWWHRFKKRLKGNCFNRKCIRIIVGSIMTYAAKWSDDEGKFILKAFYPIFITFPYGSDTTADMASVIKYYDLYDKKGNCISHALRPCQLHNKKGNLII